MPFHTRKEISIIINNIIHYNFIFKTVITCRISLITIVGTRTTTYICHNHGYYLEAARRGTVTVNFEDFLIELLVNIEQQT